MSTRVRTSQGGFHRDGFNFGQQFGLKAVARGKPVKRRWAERPTKYSKEVVERLCDVLADGAPISGASVVAEIAVSTVGKWRERHNELEQRIAESGEMARQKALRAIKAA